MTGPASGPPPRFGVLRSERGLPVIASAEARVIRGELERRLGPIMLDLRIDGDQLADWLPIAHAAWPVDVDAIIDSDQL